MYQISCCSTVDLSQSVLDSRNIPYIKMRYTIDGVEYNDDLGHSMSYKDFYNRIKNGAMPTTSQVNPDGFIEHFTPILEKGLDILHITLSSGLSGTYKSALQAANILKKSFPDRQIRIVDSLGASSGSGMLVVLASDMQKEGKSLDEVYNWLEANKLNMNYWYYVSDLSHLRRGGRISAASAIVGNMLNICPVMNVDKNGKLQVCEKVRGTKKAMKNLLNKLETLATDGTNYSGYCFIAHADCEEYALALKELVNEEFSNIKSCEIFNVGCVIGSHTGPSLLSIYFMGKSRTE